MGRREVDRSLGLDSIEIQRNQFLVHVFFFHSYYVLQHILALSIFTVIANVHFARAILGHGRAFIMHVCRLDVGGRADCQTRIHAESMCAFEADKSIRILTTRAVN